MRNGYRHLSCSLQNYLTTINRQGMIPPQTKKHFGQHFLNDTNIARKICDTLSNAGNHYQQLLEIGPGSGVLTQHLAKEVSLKLWLLEIDPEWVHYLEQHFPDLSDQLIREDIMAFDFSRLGPQPFGVIGNFPYNVASQILLKIIDNAQLVPEFVGMFQWDVVQRLTASPGNKQYGMLSVILQHYYHVHKVFKIPPGTFSPPPKVQSGVVQGIRKGADFPETHNYPLFFRVVKMAFQQRRKQLGNALKNYKSAIEQVNPEWLKRRPEELRPQDFQQIVEAIAANN